MYADRTCAYRRAMNRHEWELVHCMEVDAQAPAIEARRRFDVLTHGTRDIDVLRAEVLKQIEEAKAL